MTVMMVLVSSCATTSMMTDLIPWGAETSYESASGEVYIVNPKFDDDLEFDFVDTEMDGKKIIQANVTNNSKKSVYIRYRLEWFNDEGVLINHNAVIEKLKIVSRDTRYIYKETLGDYRYRLTIY